MPENTAASPTLGGHSSNPWRLKRTNICPGPETSTIRSASGYGSGRSSIASSTLKRAALTPMPRDRVTAARAANPGLRASRRAAYERSRHIRQTYRRIAREGYQAGFST
jgi:hypothetical protein